MPNAIAARAENIAFDVDFAPAALVDENGPLGAS
jgi:hypothetical protein